MYIYITYLVKNMAFKCVFVYESISKRWGKEKEWKAMLDRILRVSVTRKRRLRGENENERILVCWICSFLFYSKLILKVWMLHLSKMFLWIEKILKYPMYNARVIESYGENWFASTANKERTFFFNHSLKCYLNKRTKASIFNKNISKKLSLSLHDSLAYRRSGFSKKA